MPKKDGFQVCKDIRAWEREHGSNSMPIVALSAHVMSDMAERYQEASFTRYMSKPVVFQELRGKHKRF